MLELLVCATSPCFFLCGAGNRTWDFMHARSTLPITPKCLPNSFMFLRIPMRTEVTVSCVSVITFTLQVFNCYAVLHGKYLCVCCICEEVKVRCRLCFLVFETGLLPEQGNRLALTCWASKPRRSPVSASLAHGFFSNIL